MVRCIVQICRNNTHKTKTTDKNTKYHPFPKDADKRSEWMRKLRSDNRVLDSNACVCSEHFLSTDFERDLKAELLKLPPKRILKPEAVPSVNLHQFAEDLPSQEKESRSWNGENKENRTDSPNGKSSDGYVISYLGKPRLLITNTCTKAVDKGSGSAPSYGNQSKIVSLTEPQNFDELPVALRESSVLPANNANLVTNKNVFNLDDLCRLCGSYSNRMVPIFGNPKCNFPAIIENHFPEIEVRENDILPTQICFKCENSVTTWYQFYKTCNTVNKRFQSIAKKLINEPDVEEKLVVQEDIDIASENSRNCEIEKMDRDVSDALQNNVEAEDEIEIVEVKPELFSSYDDVSNVSEVEVEKIEGEKKSDNENKCSVEIKTESDWEEFEMEDEKLELESTEEDDLLADNDAETILPDFPLKSESKSLDRLSKRRLRRRQMSMGALRMCHMCGKVFKYPESLRRHLKTVHSDERPFKCHLCASSFNRNHNLTIHIKVVHQRQRVYPKKKIPRLCDYCGKVLLSSRSLEEHISCMHTKRALYECDKCHTTFYRKLSFEKHRATNQCDHKVAKSSTACKSEEVFLKYCEICGLEFKKEHFYLKHKLKHMTSFTCSVCSIILDDSTLLKEHMYVEHPEVTPFECGTCGKKFKTKTLLNCHAIIHSGEKRHKCEYCSIKFLKKKYLTTHILTHTGERPFVCTICGKGFKQSGDMRKHKATHIRKQL